MSNEQCTSPAEAPGAPPRHESLFPIVHEDDDLLVINKPSDLVCHPTKGDAFSSLISRVRIYLGPSRHPHLLNRLDRETTGLVLVAKTDRAALEIRQLWESGAVTKVYEAIVHGAFGPGMRQVNAPLGKDEQSPVAIKNRVRPDGAPAVTHFETLSEFVRGGRPLSWVRARPLTGRKHQIRIHLAHLGHPIVGDKIYGPDPLCYLDFVRGALSREQREALVLENHALHAGQLNFSWRGRQLAFAAQPEAWFLDFLRPEMCHDPG
jgi:23S rRNA pseudouridine1911/1915/1917 synthase